MSASLPTKIVIESEGSVCVRVCILLACVIHHGKCAHTKGEAHSERTDVQSSARSRLSALGARHFN
jgi:hypothetical protein